MPLPASLSVALKEWASVCAALESGRQMVLLRKGGILEAIGGFELEHRDFLLFPTYLHQKAEMLKPDAHIGLEPRDDEPAEVMLSAAATVTDIIKLRSRDQMDRIEDAHVWTPPLIDMRFNYRPMNPLYLLIVRAYRLSVPVKIANIPAYAGCKSWVPLEEAIALASITPAMNQREFDERRKSLLDRIG